MLHDNNVWIEDDGKQIMEPIVDKLHKYNHNKNLNIKLDTDAKYNEILENHEIAKLSSKKYNRSIINGVKDDLEDATIRMSKNKQISN